MSHTPSHSCSPEEEVLRGGGLYSSHPGSPHELQASREPMAGIRLSADDINNLVLAEYTGPIVMVDERGQMEESLATLRGDTLLGFDIEKRPAFRKGVFHHPALLQLAGSSGVFIFRLTVLGLPSELTSLLADERIVKTGVAVERDIHELRAIADFKPNGFSDLGIAAAKAGLCHHGLRGLAALIFRKRIAKGAKLTNWEQPQLSPRAIRYAATDAWIAREIYKAMHAMRMV